MPSRCAVRITGHWSQFQRQPHRNRVERHGQRLLQRHGPEIFVVIVLRLPAFDLDRLIVADRLRRQPALDRGEIDERLEGRARLAARRNRAVELALRIISAPDHGANRALGRHRDHRALANAGLVALGVEQVGQRLFGAGLQPRVEGGDDDDVLLDVADLVVERRPLPSRRRNSPSPRLTAQRYAAASPCASFSLPSD